MESRMNVFFIYVATVVSCWAILLEPDLQFNNTLQNTLQVRIENVWLALMVSAFYSLSVVLAVYLPSQTVTVHGRSVVRFNCNWVLSMPYLLHCLNALGNNLVHIYDQLNNVNIFVAENFCRVLVKIILVYSLQVFCLLEIVLIVFYAFKVLAMDGSRLY